MLQLKRTKAEILAQRDAWSKVVRTATDEQLSEIAKRNLILTHDLVMDFSSRADILAIQLLPFQQKKDTI